MPSGRPYIAVWEAALLASGLPVATSESGRPRFAIGALLPSGVAGLAELAELWLTERLAAWRVRAALGPVLPPGHSLETLEDVWLAAPSLPSRVAAADYLVLLHDPPDIADLRSAAGRLLAASAIPRQRSKGTTEKTFDLRRLILDVAIDHDDSGATQPRVRIRTRIHPEIGSGRPDDVLAALADDLGDRLVPASIVRERLLLAEDLEASGPPHD